MKTFLPREAAVERKWVLMDAEGQSLGRLAVRIANVLRGKHKPIFTPAVDTGDFVVVVNAEKVKLTGKKEEQKIYHRYSGYRGGLKETPAAQVRATHPDWLITLAVRRMLPKNHLSRNVLTRLKVYAGTEHPHAAQKPAVMQ
jgi:large subunit ribosomal protein L13